MVDELEMRKLGAEPFDRSELGKCRICRKGLGHNRQLAFYEVSVGQVVLDLQAIQQIAGMEMYFGGEAAIASMFVPTSTIGWRTKPTKFLVCGDCLVKQTNLASLWSDE